MATDSSCELVFEPEFVGQFCESVKTFHRAGLSDWLRDVIASLLENEEHKWETYKSMTRKISLDDFDNFFTEVRSICEKEIRFSEIAAHVLAHLVIFHFKHFIMDLIKDMLLSSDAIEQSLAVTFVLPILDPCSGFLRWSPKFLEEFGDRTTYDFFSASSPDLQTEFGQTLTSLRLMIYQKAMTLIKDVKRNWQVKESVFVPSFLSKVIRMIAPIGYRQLNVGCGFPHKVEVLISISNYQKVHVFTKDKNDQLPSNLSTLMESWLQLYSRLTSFAPNTNARHIVFAKPEDTREDRMISILKLVGFTNPGVTYEFDKSIGKYIFNLILGDDPSLAAFAIVWAQSLMMVDPTIVFYIFDEIFALIPLIGQANMEPLHTFVHAVGRFVDVLSCLSEKYISDSQCLELHVFSLVAMCAPCPRIRKSGYKLAVALDRYQGDDETAQTVVRFIAKHKQSIEKHMMVLFESFPAVHLWIDPLENMTILEFFEVMHGSHEILWQLMLSSLFTHAASFFTQTFMIAFRRIALLLVKGHVPVDPSMTGRIFTMNLLTGLGAMGSNPLLFSDHTNKEEVDTIRKQSGTIVECIMEELQNYIDVCYPNIRIMMSTVAVSLFSDFVPRFLECKNLKCMVVAMRGMAWNVDFCTVAQNDDFRTEFCRMYAVVIERLLQKSITPRNVVVKLEEQYVQRITENSQLVRDFLVITYRILLVLKQRFAQCPLAPFPCCEMTLITEDELVRTLQRCFPVIIACSLYPVTDNISEKLRCYALHSLSMHFACCPLEDPGLLSDQAFLDMIYGFSEKSPGILFSLLGHNLVHLLPVYLQKSITSGGVKFFTALCSYFKTPRPQAVTLAETLLQEWESVNLQSKDKHFQEAINTLYEEGGNLIASCLLHLALTNKQIRDSAFILLASVSPILLTINARNPGEQLRRLFQAFIHFSKESLSVETANGIAHVLCSRMPFCMEQVIDRLFDAFTEISVEHFERVFFVMSPMIEAVRLDLENRRVSSQTERTFMRFSCCSFVERLVKLLTPLDIDAEDSLLLSIWPSLAARSGFEFVLLSLIGSTTSSPDVCKSVMTVIATLYRSDPAIVLDCLTKHLSFNFWLNDAVLVPLTHTTMLSEMLSKDDAADGEPVSQTVFIFETLVCIAEDNVAGLIPYLPVMFAACVLNQDRLRGMLLRILRSIARHLDQMTPPMVHDLIRFETHDISDLAAKLYNVLEDLKPSLADDFSIEILKWAMCCGDAHIAKCAVQAYSGFLYPCNVVVIGLFARIFWILSTALAQVTQADPNADVICHIEYMSSIVQCLYQMAQIEVRTEDTNGVVSIFWMATECLRCTDPKCQDIFDAALQTIIFLAHFRDLFSLLRDPSAPYQMNQFTPNVFWKYHKPWSEKFVGYLPLICAYEGTNVSLCIKAITMLLILNYPCLLTQKENWMYIVLVLLMPWMWKVVMTDMSHFIFTSEDAALMDSAIEILQNSVSNPVITAGLDVIENQDASCYDAIQDVFREALKHVESDDIPMIARFYRSILFHGDKDMKLPLYALAALLVEAIPDSVKYMREFSVFAEGDPDRRNQFGRKYLAAVRSQAANLQESDYIEFEKSNRFPVLRLMERIVVVDTPHLYEFDEGPETTAQCGNLNGFLPICPVDPCFVDVPVVQRIRNSLERMEMPPFRDWSSQIGKGMTFLFDDKNTGKTNIVLEDVRFNELVPKTTTSIAPEVSHDTMETIFLRSEVGDPYDFIYIGDPKDLVVLAPNAFVPSFDVVNGCGQELFE